MLLYAIVIVVLCASTCLAQFGGGGACAIDQKCYVPCPDYTLADAFPFIRQTPISCEECMNLCNKLQKGTYPFVCASAVFDSQYGSCDIFAVSDQSSGFGRRKRHHGGMNTGGDIGGGGTGGQQKVPHKQKYPGRIYLQPTGFCAGQGGNGTDAGGSTTASSGASGASDTTTTAASTTTTSASAAKKKVKDQSPLRRKDDVAGRCIAARTRTNRRDCSRGIRFVGKTRQVCKPTSAECRDS